MPTIAEQFDLQELSRRTGVTARTVRYYIQQGLLRSPGFGPSATYDRGHLLRLELIRRLQRQHLPLAEIKVRLDALSDESVERLLEAPSEPQAAAGSAADYVRAVLAEKRPTPAAALPVKRAAAGLPRTQWERVAIGANLELHVRHPLTADEQRRLEQLLAEALRLFPNTR